MLRTIALLACLVAAPLAPALADVSQAPQITPATRVTDLAAVARLRGEDAVLGGCTAVLIAPSVALTAGHCISRPRTRALTFDPVGPNRFRVLIDRVVFHPLSDRAAAAAVENFAHDLALLHLANPVPPEIASPLRMIELDDTMPHGTFGYVNRRTIGEGSVDALRGHEPCFATEADGGAIASNCAVAAGQSGGALVRLTENGPLLVGILVARLGSDDFRSLIAPVRPAEWPALAGALAQ
jgi:hypothetical protein